ncbi:hypothetical protein K505DRAFT_154684, partial [Melanomma pulvis-pyrius CBS 109.77]
LPPFFFFSAAVHVGHLPPFCFFSAAVHVSGHLPPFFFFSAAVHVSGHLPPFFFFSAAVHVVSSGHLPAFFIAAVHFVFVFLPLVFDFVPVLVFFLVREGRVVFLLLPPRLPLALVSRTSCVPPVISTTPASSGVTRATVDVVARGLEVVVRACSSLFFSRAKGVTPKKRSDARNTLENFIFGGKMQAHGQMFY